MPSSPPVSTTRVAAAVAPCSRDPPTKIDLPLDPRLQPVTSFYQTAVVLPTQTKPSSTVTTQPDNSMQVEQTAGSDRVENIFDLLLKDLNPVKSEPVAVLHVAADRTCSGVSSELKTADSASTFTASSGKDSPVVHQESDDIRKLTASPRPAVDKPDDVCHDSTVKSFKAAEHRASSHSPKPDISETKHADTKHSKTIYDETDGRPSSSPDREQQSQRCSGTKADRRRASSQDRDKPRGLLSHHLKEEGRRTADVHGKEKDISPAAKRMRRDRPHDELKHIASTESLPADFTYAVQMLCCSCLHVC